MLSEAALQNGMNMLVASAHCSLVAVGFTLVYKAGRVFQFSHAGVYTIGAYTAYSCGSIGATASTGLIAGTLFASAVGAGLELGIYRPLRTRHATPQAQMLASLGVLAVVESLVSLLFGTAIRSINSPLPTDFSYQWLGIRFTVIQLTIVVVAVALNLVLVLTLCLTRQGLALRSIWSDRELAYAQGVHVDTAILGSSIAGSLFAGTAGGLWAYNTALMPLMGFRALLVGAIAAIIGGFSIIGAVVGALVISGVQQVTLWWAPGEWEDSVVFLVLICFLLAKPKPVRSRLLARRG